MQTVANVNYAKFLDTNLLNQDKRTEHLRQIGLVTDALVLLEDKTVNEMVKIYQSSVGKKLAVGDIARTFGISPTKRIDTFNKFDRILIKILIALAKDPALLIIDNPINQLDLEQYRSMMMKLQAISSSTGIGVVLTLSNLDLIDHFPGRSF